MVAIAENRMIEGEVVVDDIYEESIDIDKFLSKASLVSATEKQVTLKTTDVLHVSNTGRSEGEVAKVDTSITFIANSIKDGQEMLKEAKTLSKSDSNYNYKKKWDSSKQVKIYTKIFYTDKEFNGEEYYKLTKVTGGIKAGGHGNYTEGGVYIDDNSCYVAYFGKDQNGHTKQFDKTNDYSNSKRSWSYSLPNPSFIETSASGSGMGARSTVRLKRGSHTWSVSLVNNCL